MAGADAANRGGWLVSGTIGLERAVSARSDLGGAEGVRPDSEAGSGCGGGAGDLRESRAIPVIKANPARSEMPVLRDIMFLLCIRVS